MKTFMALAMAAALLGGCSKQPSGDVGKVPVKFNAGISAVITKSVSTAPMGNGVKADILPFEQGSDVTVSLPVIEGGRSYACDAGGNLTGDPMILDTRAYDFYSVSENTTAAPALSFTRGIGRVTNGVDYLWAKTSKAISSTDSQVTLVYTHSAVKITVEVVAESGSGLVLTDGKTTLSFTPSDDALATIKLADGTIAQASAVGASVGMTMNGHSGSSIMIPLAANIGIDFSIAAQATLNGTVIPCNYVSRISAPSGGFLAGKEYRYTACISQSQVMFSGAQVTDWEVVDNDLPLED